jgi:hypothetical protein
MNNNQFKIYLKPMIAPASAVSVSDGFPASGVFIGEDI